MNAIQHAAPVSVVVTTYNEEQNIEACLRSVTGWCQEVIVVDSGSTDQTVEISRRYADTVCFHEYIDHSSQWTWVLEELPLKADWLLALDADNVVSDRLKSQIEEALANDEPGVDGYYCAHTHYFRNRPVRGLKSHWLRLVRRRNARVDTAELVDFRFIVNGKTRRLSGEIAETNQKELSIDFWIDKHQKFSSRTAVEEVLRRAGRIQWDTAPRLFGNNDERIVWLKVRWYGFPLYIRPFLYFFYRYFLRLGVLDGRNGLVFHLFQALWFRMLVDVKVADLRRQLAMGDVTIEELERSARPG